MAQKLASCHIPCLGGGHSSPLIVKFEASFEKPPNLYSGWLVYRQFCFVCLFVLK
jgi:hypothetical protein